VRDGTRLANIQFTNPNHPPLTMKTFILKVQLFTVLWSIRQKIHLTEAILEQVKKDIKSAQEILRLIEEYVPESGVSKKLAKLEESRQAKQRELEELRHEESRLCEELAT
jgi:hypothetical protein